MCDVQCAIIIRGVVFGVSCGAVVGIGYMISVRCAMCFVGGVVFCGFVVYCGVCSVVYDISCKVCGVVCYLVWYLSNTIVVSGLLRFLRCGVRVWCAA